MTIFPLTLQRTARTYRGVLSFASTAHLPTEPEAYLHPLEFAQYQTLRIPARQTSFLLGRFLARQTLHTYLGEASPDVYLTSGVFQQPLVVGTPTSVGVSLSHTADQAACLVFSEEHPMGVDLERVQPGNWENIGSQLTPHEKGLWDGKESMDAFYTRLWTVKEALSKVLRTGLTVSMEFYEIASVTRQKDLTCCQFKHFLQYKALTFAWNACFCTVVLPAESEYTMTEAREKIDLRRRLYS
ncbi:Phosphopantetheinyl transferase [Catalinimonas alkaloidigena]|uniref:Phosphopantetheinyl transferase n=1 Tax=Catalinimonas alkaloidigena TaxID=1075417 RepID=A0A1G9RS00_9BACT|nr:4'-phosphopantetheinyl transferase superfamily protein [Catalinimonas alkaloidigena]SDM25943.1 Phosphopantetheinyl transferase [Catalinimonas alkaloidigena]